MKTAAFIITESDENCQMETSRWDQSVIRSMIQYVIQSVHMFFLSGFSGG